MKPEVVQEPSFDISDEDLVEHEKLETEDLLAEILQEREQLDFKQFEIELPEGSGQELPETEGTMMSFAFKPAS